jgi:hypothetical protein
MRMEVAAVVGLIGVAGCAAEAKDGSEPVAAEVHQQAIVAAAEPAPPPMTPADSAEVRATLEGLGEELRARFGTASVLTAREVAELRLDVNAKQIASARELGTRVPSEGAMERLLGEGRLVELEDSTTYWILRRMDHSTPMLTPDAEAMLVEIGRRFHARLQAQGVPPYRMRITSALRTDADQAALRRTNPNASRIVSAHEFGTTVDVSHERFAVPAGGFGAYEGAGRMPELEVEILEEVGREHSRVLQAKLGRAIWELRQEGALHVMMEDAQPVYHMTVARPLATTE